MGIVNQPEPGPQHPHQQPYPPGPAQPYPPQYQQQPYPSQPYPPQPYPPQNAQQYPPPGSHGPIYQARFRKHTGMIIIAQWSHVSVVGDYQQIRKAYRAAQTHNLLAGWWGLISALVYNWIALIGNMSEMNRIKQLARQNGEQV